MRSLYLLLTYSIFSFSAGEIFAQSRPSTGKQPSFEITPNPGNGQYAVTYKSEGEGDLHMAVSDATGKYVYLKSIRDFSGELKETVDISSNPRGVYIFEIEYNSGREAKKVIFQ